MSTPGGNGGPWKPRGPRPGGGSELRRDLVGEGPEDGQREGYLGEHGPSPERLSWAPPSHPGRARC